MEWFPAELSRGEMVWRLAAPVFIQFILSLWAAMCCRLLEIGLAPDHTPPDNVWPLAGCPFAIDDPTFGQIVRRHFHVYVVSNDRADPVTAHFTCRLGDDPSSLSTVTPKSPSGRISLVLPSAVKSSSFAKPVPCVQIIVRERACPGAEPCSMKGKKWAGDAAIKFRRKRR